MARYIDADKLIADIEEHHVSDGKFQHWVETQPTADVVEVVRCGECKHTYLSDNFGITAPWLMCKRHIGNAYKVSEGDYCSWGERRTDE